MTIKSFKASAVDLPTADAFFNVQLGLQDLKQIDFDGKFQYSEVKKITFDNGPSVSIFPNPARNAVNISGLETGDIVEVRDVAGQVIKTVKSTGSAINLNIADVANGIYYVLINKNNGVVESLKIVKTN